MKKNNNSKRGFTLIEAMFALAIGGIVLGAVAALLVQGMSIWKDFTGQWLICQQSRIARERILRGTFGSGGLRDANTNMIAWHTNSSGPVVTFSNPKDSNHFYSVWISTNGNMMSSKIRNGQSYNSGFAGSAVANQINSKGDVLCDLISCTMTNRQLIYTYKMSLNSNQKTYSTISEIRTCILNN